MRLTVASGYDIQENIYNTCVQAHIPILMLKSVDFSLEQIFLELTATEEASETEVNAESEKEVEE